MNAAPDAQPKATVLALLSSDLGHRTFGGLLLSVSPPPPFVWKPVWCDETPGWSVRSIRKLVSPRIGPAWLRARNGDLSRGRHEWAAGLVGKQLAERHGVDQAAAMFVNSQINAFGMTRLMRRVPTILSADMVASQAALMLPERWRWTMRLNAMLERRAFRAAAASVFMSAWARDAAVADYGLEPGKTHVIPPGVDLERLRPSARGPAAEHGPLRLLFVGNDFVRKGGRVLVRSLSDPRLRGRAKLDILSSAGDAQEAARSADNIRVHRNVTAYSPQWLQRYAEADVLVFPTTQEAFGLAAVEGLAAGLPVITTRLNALPEIVPDGRAGLLVPPDDAAALTTAIVTLLDDPARRQSMAAAAHAQAMNRFDLKKTTAALWAVIRSVAVPSRG